MKDLIIPKEVNDLETEQEKQLAIKFYNLGRQDADVFYQKRMFEYIQEQELERRR